MIYQDINKVAFILLYVHPMSHIDQKQEMVMWLFFDGRKAITPPKYL